MRRTKWHQNYPIWILFWVIETKTLIHVFVSITRLKTMFKLDNFGVILFVSFSYKKLLQYSFYENLKNRCKIDFSTKKFKKVCVLQRRACNKFKCNCLENYNDSEHTVKTKNAAFFMIFPNISFFSYGCNWLDWSFNMLLLHF